MKRKRLNVSQVFAALTILMIGVATATYAGEPFTRGIGIYPGRLSEYDGPRLVKDTTYHNMALFHTALASGSEDYNLTAQLSTDGLVSNVLPPTVKVSTAEGILSLRDMTKSFDGNIHSFNLLVGENGFIQYDWRNMEVSTSLLKLNAVVIFHPEKTAGCHLRVLASDDGSTWQEIGSLSTDSLPGEATTQKMSSDPNKEEAKLYLPLRNVNLSIPIKRGSYKHLRLACDMPGAAYWRIYECLFTDDERGMLPDNCFGSAWVSPRSDTLSARQQWLSVDLGDRAQIKQLVIHWLERPVSGVAQVSDDGLSWTDVAPLTAMTRATMTETIPFHARGRYVRLLMTKPNASGIYAVSELEAWGNGGMTAMTSDPLLFEGHKMELNRGWRLCREGDNHWIPATVPATVLSSYRNIGAVPDNTYSNNMRQISESYFHSNFLYHTVFSVKHALTAGTHLFLNFDGIDWCGIVTVNGQEVGRIKGAFMRGRFDITSLVRVGENNLEVKILQNDHPGPVKIKNAESTDLNGGVLGADNPTFHASVGWDWITSVPGRDMGIWDNVTLSVDRGVHVSDPLVTTELDATHSLATMTPTVHVTNETASPVTTTVKGWIGTIHFEQDVTLAPRESRDVTFRPSQFSQLCGQRMHLWWPNGYGDPYLYDAGFSVDGDSMGYKVGIRQMAYRNSDTDLTIYVNGKRLVPLGGNWGFSEINLNYRAREYDAAIRFHKDMNFTMIRNWVGQVGDKEFFEACDRYGIMVWEDFWLANPWDGPDPYHEDMFMANARDFIRRLRQHPCMALYVGRNEGYPPQSLDHNLRQAIAELHPQLSYIPNSAADGVTGGGRYRNMPVDWYFANQTRKLHSERGMANVPSLESVTRMLAPKEMWPLGEAWGQHDFTLGGAVHASAFHEILDGYFGRPQNVRQFISWGQWVNYDAHRAMFEGEQQFRKGLLMWMSHPCWPSMVWQTYDYYLEPTAAFFAIRKACEPLHLQYNSDKNTVEIVDIAAGPHKVKAIAEYYDMNGLQTAVDRRDVTIGEDQTITVMEGRNPQAGSHEVWFLRLKLLENDKQLTENTYVLSNPAGHFEALKELPEARVNTVSHITRKGEGWQAVVTLTNQSDVPALMVRLNLKGTDGEQVLPVSYSDNYFHLMPHENKSVTISWKEEDTRGCKPRIEVTTFN